ncbi:MAG: porin [Pseudaminobacter sp.]|nr:porin [Pseudaminobacter sp.]
MNIKSLLLGSAAALVAVTGARAADAVVIAEPEPMEYVRICDVYGTGFYYIPGTETCLRVGGYVRYDIGFGDLTTYGFGVDTDGDPDDGETYYKRARANVKLDARSETELGTLRGYINLNFNFTRGSADGPSDGFGINDAYIELGGFRVGKTDSLFSTFTGYAGGVIADDLGVPYGPFGTHQIAYTFTGGNGFAAAVALEVGDDSYDSSDLFNNGGGHPIDDYMPHVVAGVSYTQGWGGVSVVGGYDAFLEEGAVKGRIDVNATEQLSLFLMAGWSSNDPDGVGIGNINANNYYAQWNGDWAVWGGGTFKATEKAAINVQLSYDEDENFAAVANVAYTLVPGLVITPEIQYVDNFDVDDTDAVGGFLRFQRNF